MTEQNRDAMEFEEARLRKKEQRRQMPKQIMHCADDLQDASKLVLVYAYRDGEERSLRYSRMGDAILMLGFIVTPERGWTTRLIQPSRDFATRYLASRRQLHVAECI